MLLPSPNRIETRTTPALKVRPGFTFAMRWMFLAWLLFLSAVATWAQPTLTARLDRNTVSVGETVTLSLVFEGINAGGSPNLPPLPNVTVMPGLSQRSEMSFDNGRQSARLIYDYQLVANQPGDIVIPAMQVNIGGRTLTSQPVGLKIVPANAAAQAALTNLALLKLIASRSEVYLGEPFPVEMHLYWQNAREVRIPQLNASGFSIGQGPKPTQTRTQIGSTIYNLVIIKLTATAAKTGLVNLGPAESSLIVQIPLPNQQRRRDPFGFFDFGQQVQERPTTLTSETIPIRVLPLPKDNVPEGFSGAIGSYQIAVSAGPTNLAVGDPITVRVQISGSGPLEALALPAQAAWRDFNTYPPSAKVEANDELGLSGVKSFEQVIIPQNHELKELPPFRFTFFDPRAKAYVTRTAPAIPLSVRASAAAAPPPLLTNANAQATPPADDIIHIRPRLELAGATAPLLIFQPWFLGLQGLPALCWFGLFVWRKRRESLASNPRLRRQREVAQRVREGLKQLRMEGEAQKSVEFFATLFRLLQEQLGERLDLPASAITEAVIDERLRGRDLPDTTLKALHELFQTCNAARYAPIQSRQELAALIPKLEGVLNDLKNLKA